VIIYSYKYNVPFTYSIEKVGEINDTLRVDIENLFDKIDWLKRNEDSSK